MTEADRQFLTASAINIYLESLRSDGRVILYPQDIPILYELIHVITNPIKAVPVEDTARSRELTEGERQHVLQAILPDTNATMKSIADIQEIDPIPSHLRRPH
jgi:hypothetical protein